MSKNLKISLCLSKLKNAVILETKRHNIKCIVIPIEENSIYVSEKGLAYLNMYANAYSEPKEDGTTHEIVGIMSEKEKKKRSYFRPQKKRIIGYVKTVRNGFTIQENSDVVKIQKETDEKD